MAVEVDVRGYSCPVPVVKTKKAMEENPGKELKVITDTQTSVQNVTRLGKNSGYKVDVREDGEDFVLVLIPEK
ncbi:MAG: sulfurtransferase TusA family protein [Dehalococcoidales bacterium]|jgi:tRNA 2-thiouridine synthesizing protein A|nr:sulfurtransferase TusA family protein [Dehalococcoidales bacterium]MDD3265171.1 sulfurtransferase TusA family protein [Dehalococcoidales bacterium]MDD4322927.1 sulfurtransferase TusA family protein [Dehalococcoidales bacterium]MDD4794679.1 sulfurtransferase TusA family protein [Dehalococcoidales bacterium]MDD5122673.1 sulfurtransferase TusA family protein [Dehalococcoidales bacterium]